jgi:hypothetical protein
LREDIIGGRLDNREDLKKLQVPIIFVLFNKVDSKIENKNPIKADIIKETIILSNSLNQSMKMVA